MAIERRDDDPLGRRDPAGGTGASRGGRESPLDKVRDLPLPAVIVIGALAAFGAIAAVQWVLASLLGLLKFALVLVIIAAAAAWAISTKAGRDDRR